MNRAGLEVEARRLDRRGHVETVAEVAEDRLEHGRADPVRAAAAEPEHEPAVAQATVGDIIDGIRRPAPVAWKPNGFRSCSPSMLLSWIPVPGTNTPDPEPFEQVTLAHPPSPSSAVMWVVDPSRSAEEPGAKPGS